MLLIGGGALGTAVAKGGLGMGVGIILGAVACWFVGQQLNVERPKALVAQDAQQRGAELHALPDAGTFHLGPGYAPPTSLAEAHQQADQVLGAEVASVAKARSNAHTLFFIPLQSWAYIGAALGAVTAIASMFPRR